MAILVFMKTITSAILSTLTLGIGCAAPPADAPTDPPPAIELAPLQARAELDLTIPVEPIPTPSQLTRCLDDGGRLLEVDAIDNDDTAEHGEVVAFDVSDGGRLAVATVDGNIKLWTLAGLEEVLEPGIFAYGVEFGAPVSTDLAFVDERVVTADAGGLVSMETVWGGFDVLGGTTPDTPMTAVAVDPAGTLVAHADAGGGNVLLRDLETRDVRGPLASAIRDVTDLAFLEDGSLLIAGSGDSPRLERWGAGDGAEAFWDGADAIREIAGAAGVVAAAGGEAIQVFDSALERRVRIDAIAHGARSVSLTSDGGVVFTVGDEGALRAWSARDGGLLSGFAIEAPVSVRTWEDLVFVASRDGMLRAFACE